MNTNAELVTITDAAKRLAISRPRLSIILKQSGVKKVTRDGRELVAFHDVQNIVQTLAAQGRLRPSRSSNRTSQQVSEHVGDRLVEHLQNEIKRLTLERNEMTEKLKAAVEENVSLKLLQEPKPATSRHGATSRRSEEDRGSGLLSGVLRKSKAIVQAIRD